MFWNINTIGKRLFLSFSILALNVILIFSLTYHYIQRNKDINNISKRIHLQRYHIIQVLKTDQDFLRFETINPKFYETGYSGLLVKRDSLYQIIQQNSKRLVHDVEQTGLNLGHAFACIDSSLVNYNKTFNLIKNKIKIRGFKDHGLEGRMRKYVHELEKHSQAITLSDVLMLRRHEKDFFLRKEKQYITKLNALAGKIITQLQSDDENKFLLYLLSAYHETFNELAAIDEEIGLLPNEGLHGFLNQSTIELSARMEALIDNAEQHSESIIRQNLIINMLIGVGSIVITFTFTYVTTLRLTRPIKKLSTTIGKYIINKGLNEEDLREVTDTNEIQTLATAFIRMTRKLKAQFNEIRKKSELLEKRNHELQKLNEELDRFIYSSAHDLKSPLASLEGLVHLAKKEIQAGENNHYFDKMNRSIEKMEGFIKDITDYAKNKRQLIRAESVDLQHVVDEILQSLQFIPNAEGIAKSVSVHVPEFFTDKTRLEIILKNLISNAVRYSDLRKEDRYVKIDAALQGGQVIVKIEDNGIGIAEEHIYKIFDMFYRASDNSKGSGIGLFLVRESVKMLRGKIAVHSDLNKGTTFILTLPNLKIVNVNFLPESEPVQFLTAS